MFCFHNVVPRALVPVGDASLHMAVDDFAAILDWIAATYTVAPLEELAGRARAGRELRGLAAITFDDACRGVYRHAAPLLARAGVPATSFVVARAPAAGRPFWWDVLAEGGRLDAAARTRALEELDGEGDAILREITGDDTVPDLPDDLLPADWETVLQGASQGLAIEGHTATHRNLTHLAPDELARELSASRQEMAERTGREPEALAYPYGLGSPRIFDAARTAGFRTGLTLAGTPVRGGEDPLALPRLNLPAGVDVAVVECWAAGIRIR